MQEEEDILLIDSDVFLIDRRYRKDPKYEVNKKFLDFVFEKEKYTTSFNLLEITGILSYNLATSDIEKFYHTFPNFYRINIISPITNSLSADSFMSELTNGIYEIIKKKMNFGDALILKTAIDNDINTYVGWNVKHFQDKAKMIFYTPAEYLELHEKI
jgi:hypothetical protein